MTKAQEKRQMEKIGKYKSKKLPEKLTLYRKRPTKSQIEKARMMEIRQAQAQGQRKSIAGMFSTGKRMNSHGMRSLTAKKGFKIRHEGGQTGLRKQKRHKMPRKVQGRSDDSGMKEYKRNRGPGAAVPRNQLQNLRNGQGGWVYRPNQQPARAIVQNGNLVWVTNRRAVAGAHMVTMDN